MTTHDPGDPVLSQTEPQGAPQPAHAAVEPPYVHVRSLLVVAGGLVALVVVSMGGLWGWMRWLSPGEPVSPAAQTAETSVATAPGEPAVDPDQKAHRLEYVAAQNELLSSYGWIDRKAGIARIPIERAMELMRKQSKSGEEPK